MKPAILILGLTAATPLAAETSRSLGSHEHGSGTLLIAVEGADMSLIFEAPGADIVGFEYPAESAAEKTAIAAALSALEKPLDLFALPEGAGCQVSHAHATLADDGAAHDDGTHQEHDHDDHGHDDEEHGHNEHANHEDTDGHDEHEHEKHGHDEHAHEEHGHDDHDHGSAKTHTEFQAEYLLTCADMAAITWMEFPYFATHPNALELDVQIATPVGAQRFEVSRDITRLDLGRLF